MSTGIIINIRTLLTFLNGGNTEECETNDAVVCLRGWNHKRKYTVKGNNGEVGLRWYRNRMSLGDSSTAKESDW